MDSSSVGAGVRLALRRFVHHVQLLRWDLLLVGNGFWLEGVFRMERFLADLKQALEQGQPQPGSLFERQWGSWVVSKIRRPLVRVLAWCEAGAKAHWRLVTERDRALFQRRSQ